MEIKTLVSVCDTHWEVLGRFHPGQINWTKDGAKLTGICSVVGCQNETVQGIWMKSQLTKSETPLLDMLETKEHNINDYRIRPEIFNKPGYSVENPEGESNV